MKILLNETLEKALLRAIIEGHAPSESLSPDELSDSGKKILRGAKYLLANGARPPLNGGAVIHAAVEVTGADRDSISRYAQGVAEAKPEADALALVRAAQNKSMLVDLVNEAGSQLGDGNLDMAKFSDILRSSTGGHANGEIKSMADMMDDYRDPPVGFQFKTLPVLSETTGGMSGLWVLGGEAKTGKSTLAFQIGLEMAREMDVLFYDLDGTGIPYLMGRVRKIFLGNDVAAKNATKRIFLREEIHTLEFDIMQHQPPSLVILDSIQTLPVNVMNRTSALDKWIVRAKELTKKGYHMLLVSEINTFGEYKHTGELKYAGNVCIRLEKDPKQEDSSVEVNIRFNRHRRRTGTVTELARDEKRIWMFREIL